MFLYCECGWSQDDFWKEGVYSPLENDYFNSLKKELLKGKIYLPNDKPYSMIENTILHDENGFYFDSRQYVAKNLERIANTIKSMAIPTQEEWEKVKDTFKCPKCGKNDRIHVD